ncbi:hypothetical protein HOD38_05650 [archaeon]|jgi:hypothetical protein|nr:hypothetical protein [archaeon]MBT4397726.1 hypothetical protein [archaeon]MBT4441211.1 hypothetical protein [archaeon]
MEILNYDFLIGIAIWIIAGITIGVLLTIQIRNIQSNFSYQVRKLRNFMIGFFIVLAIVFIALWYMGVM